MFNAKASLFPLPDDHHHKVLSWLESYQDLLGTLMPSDLSTSTLAPEPTTTATSLLMSLIGDFIPYITGDSSDDSDTDTSHMSRDNLIRRQGLAYQAPGGGESKR